METKELAPIVRLLVENKLSDEGVECLCKSLNQEAIIEIIQGVNEHSTQQLWWIETKHANSFVRGRSSSISITIDYTKDGLWSHAFLYFLLCVIRNHPQFIVDLFMKTTTSPKYFAVKTQITYDTNTLLRFRKEHMSDELFVKFVEQLYCPENIHKRATLPVLPLPELPSQVDTTNWD